MKKFLLIFLLSFPVLYLYSQDFMPAQPLGGKQQLKYFIQSEIIYPQADLASGTEGTVQLRYGIDEKGQVSFVSFSKKVSAGCDREALRIFRMIGWEPARLRSIPVKDTGSIEIEFNIRKYNRLCRNRGYSAILYPYEPVDTSGMIYAYGKLDTAPHPIFTNDQINLAGFVAANLNYPEAAIKQNVSGVVKLLFIVEPHGRVSNIQIANSVGAGCNEEAIRILRLIKWMPGTVNRKAVRTEMSMSINFSFDRGRDGNFNPTVKSSYGG